MLGDEILIFSLSLYLTYLNVYVNSEGIRGQDKNCSLVLTDTVVVYFPPRISSNRRSFEDFLRFLEESFNNSSNTFRAGNRRLPQISIYRKYEATQESDSIAYRLTRQALRLQKP